ARLMQKVGIYSTPFFDTYRTDIIESIFLEDETRMIRFCQLIQEYSPINAYVSPYPSEMPGYDDNVIMAAGTFIQGASIELSIDGPIRAAYIALMQGGLTYAHIKIAVSEAIKQMIEVNLLKPVDIKGHMYMRCIRIAMVIPLK